MCAFIENGLDLHHLTYPLAAILFLSSEAASGNITGMCLDVNAGMEGRVLNKLEEFA